MFYDFKNDILILDLIFETFLTVLCSTVYVDPPRKQKLFLNSSGTIFLGASGYPTPSYKWKKDGLVLDQNDRNSGGRFKWLDDGSLEIPTVRVSDAGKYECDIIQGYNSKTIVIQISVVGKLVCF